MMNNIFFRLIFALHLCIPLLSAAQKDLTIQEAVLGRRQQLAPQQLSNLSWIPETNAYCYNENSENGQTLIMVDAVTFEKTELISSNRLGSFLLLKKNMVRIPEFTWINTYEARFVYGGMVYVFNRKTKEVKGVYSLPKNGDNYEFRPHSTDMAFTRDNNLFAIIDGEEIQVTHFDDPNIVAGQTVSRVEFGIEHGVIWSHTGKQLAFYQKNETNVTYYPIVDYTTRPAKLHHIKYPMAGMRSEEVKIGIYTIDKDDVLYLKTNGPSEQYLTALSWGPRDKFVYVGHLNREQNEFHLKQYSPKTGLAISDLYVEKDAKYVHPVSSLQFIDNNHFLWVSESSGINQFYLFDVNDKTFRHINSGNILVRSFVGYNEKQRKLWFLGNHKDNIDMQLFEVTINENNDQPVKQITKSQSYHSRVWFNNQSSLVIVQSSSLTIPNSYDLIELQNGEISNIFSSDNPLAKYKIGVTMLDTLIAADGKSKLHTRIIYPFNFDETKKYPVLIYVYNGPGVQLLHPSWLGNAPLWMYYFANRGYIIYTLDGRGSSNRGIEFEQVTYRKLGQIEMRDQMQGVKYLKSLPYIDTSRIAVHGWSYGGFMTTSLLTTYPGVFKVGVAGGPVMDWRYYEVMYTERYMDTPQSNKEGYDLTSNLKRASKLKDKLLIIHGTSDPVVVKQHSDLFLKECIKNGVQVDYFEYPGHQHNVYGRDRIHLISKILSYIESNL